jgi:glycosyl transferase family 25
MIPCFVINLKKDTQRRRNIESECRRIGMPFSIIDAIYGKELTAEQLSKVYDREKAMRHYKDLTVNEIAASLSHISIYRRMIDENIPHALILEDDARLSPDVGPVIAALQKRIPPSEPSVTLLTYVEHYTRRHSCILTDRHQLVRPVTRHQWLAHGYFVTLEAAKRLVDALYPVWIPADHWSLLERQRIVTIRVVAPYCIGHSELAQISNLEAGRQSRRKRRMTFLNFWNIRIREQAKKTLWPFLKVSRQRRTW